MKWSDDELAEAFRRRTATGELPGPDCLTPEELEGLALGEATAADRGRLADHLVACRRCSQLVQELSSLSGWASAAAAAHPPFPISRWLAIAALVVLAIGVLVLFSGGRVAPGGGAGPPGTVRGGSGVVVPASGARLSDPPASFEWPAQAGAAGYRLRIFDDGARPFWTSGPLTASACRLPDGVAERLAAGRGYSWAVDVEGDVRTRELGPFTFRLEARR